jgi:hypothetical protein
MAILDSHLFQHFMRSYTTTPNVKTTTSHARTKPSTKPFQSMDKATFQAFKYSKSPAGCQDMAVLLRLFLHHQ